MDYATDLQHESDEEQKFRLYSQGIYCLKQGYVSGYC